MDATERILEVLNEKQLLKGYEPDEERALAVKILFSLKQAGWLPPEEVGELIEAVKWYVDMTDRFINGDELDADHLEKYQRVVAALAQLRGGKEEKG